MGTVIPNPSSESYVHTGMTFQIGKPPEGFPQEALTQIASWALARITHVKNWLRPLSRSIPTDRDRVGSKITALSEALLSSLAP